MAVNDTGQRIDAYLQSPVRIRLSPLIFEGFSSKKRQNKRGGLIVRHIRVAIVEYLIKSNMRSNLI